MTTFDPGIRVEAMAQGRISLLGEGKKAAEKREESTEAKTNGVWLKTAGFIALAGAAAGVVLTALRFITPLLGVGLSVLFLAGGSYLLWYRETALDYSDPSSLATVREGAKKLPLAELIKTHGWENIFKHELLAQSDLTAKYREHMQGKPLDQVIRTYEEANAAYEKVQKAQGAKAPKYEIAPPKVWADKWADEKINIETVCDLFKRYDVEKLAKYEIIAGEDLEALRGLKEEFNKIKQQLIVTLTFTTHYIVSENALLNLESQTVESLRRQLQRDLVDSANELRDVTATMENEKITNPRMKGILAAGLELLRRQIAFFNDHPQLQDREKIKRMSKEEILSLYKAAREQVKACADELADELIQRRGHGTGDLEEDLQAAIKQYHQS